MLSVKMDELTRLLKSRTDLFQDPTFTLAMAQMQAKTIGAEISKILEKIPSKPMRP